MGGNVHCSFLIHTKVSKRKILDAAMQCLQSQWWWHMSKAFTPPFLPPSLCLLLFSLSCSGLHLSLNGQSRIGSCLVPVHQREDRRGEGGAQILMRCTVSMATLSEEGKKKRVLSFSLHSPLLCAPSFPLSVSPALLPSWRGALLGAR